MLSPQIRARLAKLNRAPLSPGESPPAPQPAAAVREADGLATTATRAEPLAAGREADTPMGGHLRLTRPLARVWPAGDELLQSAAPRLAALPRDEKIHLDWRRFAAGFAENVLFLDLETCGFAGSMIFLVGLIRHGEDGLALEQLLARNYAEEAAVLWTLRERVQRARVLVTFNGKAFDWPMVQDRSVLHRLQSPPRLPLRRPGPRNESSKAPQPVDPLHHIDLLHHARRRYRRRLPNCRLQTLERHLLGRRRSGDIPGSEIPDVYHEFVRTRRSRRMKAVLHHNALDLVTLLQLSLRMAGHVDSRESKAEA